MYSFHGIKITGSVNYLTDLGLGAPSVLDLYETDSKVQIEWEFNFENDEGEDIAVFIYSWKEYRWLNKDEIIHFNIGSESKKDSIAAESFIKALKL